MSKKTTNPDTDGRLDKAMSYVTKAGHKATFTGAAKVARMSPFHFHRLFAKRFGFTVKQATTAAQIELAKKLIGQGKDLVIVARACGFSHQSHFTSTFGRIVGKTPLKWKMAQK